MESFAEAGLVVTIPEKDVAPEMIMTMTSGDGTSTEALARLVGYHPRVRCACLSSPDVALRGPSEMDEAR